MNQPVLILYLEDNPRDAELVRDNLQQTSPACELRVAGDRAEYEAALDQTSFDLILSDYSLTNYDGMAALTLARAKQPGVPFILISGTLGEEQAVDCVLRGANDFVLKHRLVRLVPAVLRALTEAEEHRKRREAEEALRAIFCRQQALLSTIPEIITEVDRNKVFIWTNSAGLEFFGEDVLGKEAAFYFEGEQETYNILKPLFDGSEEVIYVESWQRRKDGEKRLLAWWCRALKDGGGNVIGAISTARDVTARKVAEDALNKSHAEFKKLFDDAPVGYHEIDAEGRIVRINATELKMLGYSIEELLGQPVWQLTTDPERSRQAVIAKLSGTMGPAQSFKREYRRKDGKTILFLIDEQILRSEDGAVSGVRSVLQDISAHKQAEETNARLVAAIEQTAEIIMITDTKGLIQYVNPAFMTVTGYTKKEALGQNPRILKSGQQSAAFYNELWATIRSGKTWQGRFVNRKKDGILYTEVATIAPVRDGTGAIINYVAVKRDLSAELNTQAQLNHANKMESVGRLAGGVAHDFNNILQIILGSAKMATNRVDPADPIRSDLEQITSAGRRATDLTRQLLAFASKQTIAPRTLNLNEVVESMLKMLRRLIGENIELSWVPRTSLWPVKMDPGQVDQILANLCINARDAIDGVGTVHIATENVRVDEFQALRHEDFLPGDYVLLTLSDTGSGMDTETQAHIFEPFFTTKAVGKGTGLGLSTVYGIVRQNKGHISVYSEPGKGTAFRIHLPRHMGAVAAHLAEGLAQPVVGGRETVMLVEDDMALLEMGGQILRKLGYTVLAAGTPEAALRMSAEHSGEIQLLLTDVIMPGMNGRELAVRLQTRHPHLKFLFMSGFTANIIAHQGVLDKGVNFIQKPFSMADLSAKMREVLAGA